jgi:tetrahydromethanopterin S-methyltransferase subunit F
MNWIIQAFNTPTYQMTALQGLTVGVVLAIPLLIIWIAIIKKLES